jgi:EAL domain-containing protein (putative c-di-GMP-specific phosphodiesterase class I)
VAPDVFIPLAEENGLITKLGEQVLAQALEQLCRWRRHGHALTLSFNLSKQQIVEARFGPRLLAQLKRLRLEPAWITLEVIERQSVLGHPLGRQRLKGLAAAGFQLAVDDFGAGYSSFELVDAVPFDELKIHMGLIRRVHDPRGQRVVHAVVEMGKTLGQRVVAEGVETEESRTILRQMGVHRLQGYLFSKALPADKFLEYLDGKQSRYLVDKAA